jgi:hypothetical protein
MDGQLEHIQIHLLRYKKYPLGFKKDVTMKSHSGMVDCVVDAFLQYS